MPAYVVNEIKIIDVKRYRIYAESMPATLTPFGGVFLARGRPEAMAGEIPSERIVILQFPDIEHARRWRNSDAYQALLLIRDESSTSRVYVIGTDDIGRFVTS
ncbi:DUF1330 domain-containing protein [Tardiphaga sp. 866_E4_N2_1]|uniref:DUF1330 domain-containing protein n=1 Tax=unclassified Tardiphaga TaxID=2631404 RepID=UPI003F29EF39